MKRILLCGLILSAGPALAQAQVVKFIGCASDGQMSSVPAAVGQVPSFAISPEAASHLAWYKAADAPGVLAPRAWHCFGTYGSNGATLYVSPEPLNAKLVLSAGWNGFNGSAIQISTMNGETSGRLEIAQRIACLFPAHMDFTRRVIAETNEPASDFPIGPFPHDTLIYKRENLVEFKTPAHDEGLGTQSRLRSANEPITGFVFLRMTANKDPYDISLEIRLSRHLGWLAPTIRSVAEQTLPAASSK